jgi:hypothetical protein
VKTCCTIVPSVSFWFSAVSAVALASAASNGAEDAAASNAADARPRQDATHDQIALLYGSKHESGTSSQIYSRHAKKMHFWEPVERVRQSRRVVNRAGHWFSGTSMEAILETIKATIFGMVWRGDMRIKKPSM